MISPPVRERRFPSPASVNGHVNHVYAIRTPSADLSRRQAPIPTEPRRNRCAIRP
jgi:hypothetical protein